MYMYLRSKNSKNGKAGSPYYVGKGKGMRAYSKQHRVRPPSDKAMIVFVIYGVSDSVAIEEEKRLISLYGRIDKGNGCLRNFTDGGEGPSGCIKSPEQIERHRLKILGKPNLKNRRPWTEEQKRAKSLSMKGISWSEKRRAAFHGFTHSPETRAKMSMSQKGKSHSTKGKPWSETRRAAQLSRDLAKY